MQESLAIIDTILTSKASLAAVSIAWVIFEIRSHREDNKAHIEERKEWAERIEKLTESLNFTIRVLERKHGVILDENNVNGNNNNRHV